jgi:hypothetical protein
MSTFVPKSQGRRGLWAAAAIAIAAALAVAWYYWGHDSSQSAPRATASSASDRASSHSTPNGSANPSLARSGASGAQPDSYKAASQDPHQAVPFHIQVPDGTPVAQVLQQLQGAADAGNARAACRVGLELSLCYRLNSNSTAEEKAHCNGITGDQAGRAWKYLYQAAASGNLAAMSRYVRDPALSTSNPADSAEAWLLYKQNAESFLTQSVQGGDPMALYFAWWNSATGFSSGGDNVFQKNPYMALAYGTAALPLLDPRRRANVVQLNAQIQSQLPADQISKAIEEGQRIKDTYFANASPTSDSPDDAYLPPSQCDK